RTGLFSSATVSLIATEELMPIASLTQTLLQTAGDNLAINVGQVQRLDFDDAPVPGYDFLDFLEKHFNEDDIGDIKRAVDKAVLLRAHTDNFLGEPINASSGFTVYVQEVHHQYEDYYKTLAWYGDSGWGLVFDLALSRKNH